MDADMAARGLEAFGPDGLDLVFLENIGNLVCPAEFDVGSAVRVMILSVPEGDEKPLQDQQMLRRSDALLITKADEIPFYDFSMEKVIRESKRLNPDIHVFQISSKYGEGLGEFELWLLKEARTWRRD